MRFYPLRRGIHSCFALKNNDPVTEDREFRGLPGQDGAVLRMNGFDRDLCAVAGIEEEARVVCGVQVSEGYWFKCGGRVNEDSLARNLRGEGLPVVGCAPARFDEIRLGFKLPPGIARDCPLGHSELPRTGKLRSDVPRGTAPGVAMGRKSVGLLACIYLPYAVGPVGMAAGSTQQR